MSFIPIFLSLLVAILHTHPMCMVTFMPTMPISSSCTHQNHASITIPITVHFSHYPLHPWCLHFSCPPYPKSLISIIFHTHAMLIILIFPHQTPFIPIFQYPLNPFLPPLHGHTNLCKCLHHSSPSLIFHFAHHHAHNHTHTYTQAHYLILPNIPCISPFL